MRFLLGQNSFIRTFYLVKCPVRIRQAVRVSVLYKRYPCCVDRKVSGSIRQHLDFPELMCFKNWLQTSKHKLALSIFTCNFFPDLHLLSSLVIYGLVDSL